MIESLVGHPYEGNFGCFVVVRKALESLGKHIPDYAEGLREIDRLAALQTHLATHAVEVSAPQRGDVVLIRVMGEPGHIGIMLNESDFLHCMSGTEACIERINSHRWKGRILGYWRV